MSRRALGALLAAAVLAAADPTLAITDTSLAYDLNGGAAMPLCWGPVALGADAGTALRIEVAFSRPAGSTTIAAATADDLLTLRSGWQVEVSDAANLSVDGQAWTWSGPVHGDGLDVAAHPLWLQSAQPVSAADALLALRQVCYANQGGPRTLVKRRAEVRLKAVGSSAGANDLIELVPGVVAVPPCLRFEPVNLHPGVDAISALVDQAGWNQAAITLTRVPAEDVAAAGMTAVPPELAIGNDDNGWPLVTASHPTSNGSWQFAYNATAAGIPGSARVVVPVEVTGAPANLRIAGALPFEIDLTQGEAAGDLALPLIITKDNGNLTLAVVDHPAAPAGDPAPLAALQAALSFHDTVIHLDRAAFVRAHAGAAAFPRWLIVGLDIRVEGEHRLVPWVVHLLPPPPWG